MRRIIELMPGNLVAVFQRLGIVLVAMFICRLLFYLFNGNSFADMSVYYWVLGIWFDCITICLWFLPYYVLFLLPFKNRRNKYYKLLFKVLFHALNGFMVALNLLDIEYFKFTGKRSTFDLFAFIGTGEDVGQLLGSFIADFWFLLLFFILIVLLSEWLYRKTNKDWSKVDSTPNFIKRDIISFLIAVPLLFLIGRGGLGLKPIGIIEASKYTGGNHTAFVLPTPFTIIKTIDQKGLEPIEYYSNEKILRTHFNPIRSSVPQNILPNNSNVVVIMLESFGSEFVGYYNNGEGFTPFLDSILGQSLAFDNGFANGKKSIEAVPAIIASMPTMMDSPYISSPYGSNKIDALPTLLKKFGYSSAFYHGATNGSMSFDGFAELCGFDKYVGRTEYNNEKHSDNKWGILDEYFNPWAAKEMSKLKEPFFSTLFTLSSHHPYYIPEHMSKKVKRGPQQICGSISYADIALKMFFEEAKKQPWYENTLFVILADHTPATTSKVHSKRSQIYRIPIAFYDPGGRLKSTRSKKVFQQMDILPTLLDLLNIKTDYYAFGSSYFSDKPREAVTYLEGTYNYFREDMMMVYSGDQIHSMTNYVKKETNVDSLSQYSSKAGVWEKRLKAIIQTYNRDLINNKTSLD